MDLTNIQPDPVPLPPPPAASLPSRRKWEWLVLILIVVLAALFRFWGLKHFSQVGGDDVEFRVHIPDHVENFAIILKSQGYPFPRLQAPLVAAVYISHWDVNKKVTSFAKPFFLLEIGLLQLVCNLRTKVPYENIWRLHQWMALLGIATVVAVFFIARRLGGPAAGCAAAFLTAVSPWAVRYSTWGLHTVGGGLWFCLAVLAAGRLSARDTVFRNLLFGVLIGITTYYSVSLIWPCLFLVLFEITRRIFRAAVGLGSRRRSMVLLVVFGIGCLLPLLAWEGVNYAVCRYLARWKDTIQQLPHTKVLALDRQPYVPFPSRLLQTVRDNAAHTGSLPADHIYFFRHLKDSEGWIVALGVGASLLAVFLWLLRRGRFKEREPLLRLMFVFISVAFLMNYTNGTQVARHYYSAALLAFVLTGVMAARALGARPALRYALWPLALLVAGLHFHHLEGYRVSRQGPYLYELWERKNRLTGQVATLNMQQWDLWPTLNFIGSWQEFDAFCAGHTHPYIMYSDYIGIAHGSWFYHTKDQLGMAETFRRARNIAFATASYLSYPPMLYENEFYYWGLYRHPSPYFDPRIKVIPIREVLKASIELKSDGAARRALADQLNREPPVVIPAWRNLIILPYMDKMSRPSYLLPWVLTSALLLVYAFLCLRRLSSEREPPVGIPAA